MTMSGGRLADMQSAGSSAASPVLVLWDIDHTLIETRGVGFAIYQRAFTATTGRALDKKADISGRTELDIMRETLRVNGIEPADDSLRQFAAALIEGYEQARHELGTSGRVLPGAVAALARLASEPLVHQGVLTGNLREVARIKLDVFGLGSYLDLDSSAYGDDHSDRAELVAIAQARAAERTGRAFDAEHTVLIGDTPKDVQAAVAAGVRVVAVASGKSSVAELRSAGAGTVITDLTDSAYLAGLVT